MTGPGTTLTGLGSGQASRTVLSDVGPQADGGQAAIGDLAEPAVLVSPETTMEALDARFRADPSLRWVMMEVADGPVLVGRTWFQIAMTGRLGYGRLILRSRTLGESAPRDSLVFPADRPVDEVAAEVSRRRRSGDQTEGVVVTWPDGHLGVTAMTALFERLARQYAYHALHDPLTGLPNRLFLLQELEALRQNATRPALCYIDLDRFKDVNDHLGHAAGDEVLVEFARRLRAVARADDLVVRLGGDEFAVLTRGTSGAEQGEALAERIVLAAAAPFVISGSGTLGGAAQLVTLGASVGVATSDGSAPETQLTSLNLLAHGDLALYRAKSLGRGRVAHFQRELLDDAEGGDAVRARHEMERRLRRAIETEQLLLHYQPVVGLPSGQVTGVEALARWHDEELGSVPPDRFIPLAERTGLIIDLGRWVLRTACAEAAGWPARPGSPAPTVAVNVSPVQLAERGFLDDVVEALTRSGLEPARLCLEITETAAITDLTATAARLEQIRALGVRLALDDFGAGYSSLTLLRSLPVHLVKIDRSFVERVTEDPADAVLVRLVVEAAHSIGRRVCAEGVETAQQAQQLVALGCDAAQGWLFGRPQAPSPQLAAVLADRAPAPVLAGEDAAALPLGHSDELVLVTGPERVITFASASCAAILGWLPQELAGTSIWDLLDPDERTAVRRRDRAMPPGTTTTELNRLRHRDGSFRWLERETRRLPDEDGALREVITVARDVTATVEAQRALAQSEAMFRHAFHGSPIGMALSALDGTLIRVNEAFAGLLGTTPDELHGKRVEDITHPDDVAADLANSAELAAGSARAHDVVKRYRRPDGTAVQARVLASLVEDAAGRPAYVFAHVLPG